ncbi:MAG: ABC transporter permease [Deltaproteobacteria bacterium]|nr:ABC transporter permease [Deltaproteobacteria bacterium]
MIGGFSAIAKRELKCYFSTPLAYVILFVFLVFASFLSFKGQFFEIRQADLRIFFDYLPILFIFLVPAIGMRLWAEERKTGTIELLFSLPVTVRGAVLGKFAAAWLFIGLALVFTFPLIVTVNYLGDPDNYVIAAGYAGAFLLAGCYLAVSIFASSLTRNQVIGFIVSVLLCSIFAFADYPSILNVLSTFLPLRAVEIVQNMSFIEHFESMRRGVIEFSDLAYDFILIAGWLAATTVVLDGRREA